MLSDYIEAKNRERVARARWNDFKHFTAGFILGSLLGSAAGLLTAPQTGEETRNDLINKAVDTRKRVQDKGEEVVDKAKGLYQQYTEGNFVEIKPDFDPQDLAEKADYKMAEGLDNTADFLNDRADDLEDKADDLEDRAEDHAKKHEAKEADQEGENE